VYISFAESRATVFRNTIGDSVQFQRLRLLVKDHVKRVKTRRQRAMNFLKSHLIRLFQDIQDDNFSTLVVDKTSLKLLNSVLKMSEILLNNISGNLIILIAEVLLVSNFANKSYTRGSSLIFLLSPTHDSVDELLRNWKDSFRIKAHILFTSEIPDSLFSRIKTSQISPQLQTLKELQLNFLPVDSLSFTLDSMDSMFSTYNPSSPSFLNLEMENIADRVRINTLFYR